MGDRLGYRILVLPNQVLLNNSVLTNEVLLYLGTQLRIGRHEIPREDLINNLETTTTSYKFRMSDRYLQPTAAVKSLMILPSSKLLSKVKVQPHVNACIIYGLTFNRRHLLVQIIAPHTSPREHKHIHTHTLMHTHTHNIRIHNYYIYMYIYSQTWLESHCIQSNLVPLKMCCYNQVVVVVVVTRTFSTETIESVHTMCVVVKRLML